jgi:hypothetical protein
MRNVKLSKAMVTALRTVETHADGRMALPAGTRTGTAVALIERGICLPLNGDDCHFLTRQGVSAWVTASDDASWNGCKVSVSDDEHSMGEFTPDAPVEPVGDAETAYWAQIAVADAAMADQRVADLTIMSNDSIMSNECTCSPGAPSPGNHPCLHCGGDNSWCAKHYPAPPAIDTQDIPSVPNMVDVPSVCYWACENNVTGAFCDYVGRTEGVCDEHAYRVTSPITLIALADWERELMGVQTAAGGPVREVTADEPVSPSLALVRAVVSGAVPTASVIQNRSGNYGVTHYHSPACGDVKREMKHWGQTESDVMFFPFKSVAEILIHEFSDVASDENEVNSREWWSSIFHNANEEKYSGIRIMPCLSIPAGTTSDGSPIVTDGKNYRAGFKRQIVEDEQTSYEVPSHTRYPHGRSGPDDVTALTEVFESGTRIVSQSGDAGTVIQPYMTGVLESTGTRFAAVTLEMDNGVRQSALIGDLEIEDAGFVETMVTKEYDLSVMVDDSTGAMVSLGWVTLTMNAAQANDTDRIAEAYGAIHGTGTPRHGWASIIVVNEVCDL